MLRRSSLAALWITLKGDDCNFDTDDGAWKATKILIITMKSWTISLTKDTDHAGPESQQTPDCQFAAH